MHPVLNPRVNTTCCRSEPSLQLIDFGKAVDLRLEAEGEARQTEHGRAGRYHMVPNMLYCSLPHTI